MLNIVVNLRADDVHIFNFGRASVALTRLPPRLLRRVFGFMVTLPMVRNALWFPLWRLVWTTTMPATSATLPRRKW